jgi:hypothetical protein
VHRCGLEIFKHGLELVSFSFVFFVLIMTKEVRRYLVCGLAKNFSRKIWSFAWFDALISGPESGTGRLKQRVDTHSLRASSCFGWHLFCESRTLETFFKNRLTEVHFWGRNPALIAQATGGH